MKKSKKTVNAWQFFSGRDRGKKALLCAADMQRFLQVPEKSSHAYLITLIGRKEVRKMAIQYDLRKNHLVDGPDVYRAQVIRSRTIHFDDLVNEIADMGNTLTAVDIRGVIIALDHLIGNALAKGENVILPFCTLTSSIRGNFNGRNDDFDPERHTVHPVIKAGVSLRRLYRNGIVLEKVRHAVLGREIDSFIDRNTIM